MTKLKKDKHTQARKAARQNISHHKHNALAKSKIKKMIKKYDLILAEGNKETAKTLLSEITKTLHKSSQKNIIHKNRASRKISQLTKKLNKLQTK